MERQSVGGKRRDDHRFKDERPEAEQEENDVAGHAGEDGDAKRSVGHS
jgi:hypothetical protein